MDEMLVVALVLIGLSVLVSGIFVVACKALGGWSYLFAWATGNKDERANLANHEEYAGYADYVRASNGSGGRPPLIEPQSCFSANLKSSEEKWSSGGGPSSTVVPKALLPPAPSNSATKRFSLDLVRRTSIDTSELPDVLAEATGGAMTSSSANNAAKLQRAMSCDSVCSDTSVVFEALESPDDWTSAELNLSLEYSGHRQELLVELNQARGLPISNFEGNSSLESYVRVTLMPSRHKEFKTKLHEVTSSEASYNETFVFADIPTEDLRNSVLRCFVCISADNQLVGESEIRLSELDFSSRYRAWMPIVSSKQKAKGLGELLFSLSYLPTAERMTVVLVKARNILWTETKPSADLFVKVYLLQKGKKISKKKTSIKKGGDRNPTFNEAMIFSVPASALQNIQLRLTLAEHEPEGKKAPAVGHVFVGSQCSGKELSHWNQMISSPRKPIAMWHSLRKR